MKQVNKARFERAVPFSEFLESAVANADLWRMTAKRAVVEPKTLARAAALPGRWHLLVLADD